MRKQYKGAFICLVVIILFIGFCGGVIWTLRKMLSPVTIFDDTLKNGGIYMTEPAEIEALSEKPDILGWFETWGMPLAYNKAQLCIRKQMTPLITWQPNDYTLSDISNGVYDELIRDYLVQINETFGENTVLIRLAHEMESYYPDYPTWYPWQYYGGEQDYISMWRHVVTIGHEVAPNVRWIWSPNRINEDSLKWYPGDEYVDYVSITLNHGSERMPSYTRFEDYYIEEGQAQYFERVDKKVLLSEVAYAGSDETVKGEYMKSVFDLVEQDERICGVVFFNDNISENRAYKFSDNEYCMNIWYDGIRHLHEWTKNLQVEGENTSE